MWTYLKTPQGGSTAAPLFILGLFVDGLRANEVPSQPSLWEKYFCPVFVRQVLGWFSAVLGWFSADLGRFSAGSWLVLGVVLEGWRLPWALDGENNAMGWPRGLEKG